MSPTTAFDALQSWTGARHRPAVIAGPCSAESEAQVIGTAMALAKQPGVVAFRAGVWKPRTRPGGFAGMGDVALPWLARAQRESGLPVMVEVARATHVEQVLEAGLAMVWIGARTTVNPFLVQELADALSGTGLPVLVKNPVSPDLPLWLGAIERLEAAGIRQIGAVHRGFSQYAPGEYRNPPHWALAVELRDRRPDLPLICDPSHITGDRRLLAPVAQTAMDLGYDGLMIETHPTPDQALSDAAQQITPDALSALLAGLDIKDPDGPHTDPILDALRQRIDDADEALVQALADRLDLVAAAGTHKRAQGYLILQLDRWRPVLAARLEQGERLGLQADVIRQLYHLIHAESIRLQERQAVTMPTLNGRDGGGGDDGDRAHRPIP